MQDLKKPLHSGWLRRLFVRLAEDAFLSLAALMACLGVIAGIAYAADYIVWHPEDEIAFWSKHTSGNFYTNTSVAIGAETVDGNLNLDVNGRIGADAYCDQYGNNCRSIAELGNGSSGGDTININGGEFETSSYFINSEDKTIGNYTCPENQKVLSCKTYNIAAGNYVCGTSIKDNGKTCSYGGCSANTQWRTEIICGGVKPNTDPLSVGARVASGAYVATGSLDSETAANYRLRASNLTRSIYKEINLTSEGFDCSATSKNAIYFMVSDANTAGVQRGPVGIDATYCTYSQNLFDKCKFMVECGGSMSNDGGETWGSYFNWFALQASDAPTVGSSTNSGSAANTSTVINGSAGVLAYNYINQGGALVNDAFTINQEGLLMLTGYGKAARNGSIANAGLRTTLLIDNEVCSSDYSFEGETSSVIFTTSASCIKKISAGAHTVKVQQENASTTLQESSLQYAVIGTTAPTSVTTTAATTNTTPRTASGTNVAADNTPSGPDFSLYYNSQASLPYRIIDLINYSFDCSKAIDFSVEGSPGTCSYIQNTEYKCRFLVSCESISPTTTPHFNWTASQAGSSPVATVNNSSTGATSADLTALTNRIDTLQAQVNQLSNAASTTTTATPEVLASEYIELPKLGVTSGGLITRSFTINSNALLLIQTNAQTGLGGIWPGEGNTQPVTTISITKSGGSIQTCAQSSPSGQLGGYSASCLMPLSAGTYSFTINAAGVCSPSITNACNSIIAKYALLSAPATKNPVTVVPSGSSSTTPKGPSFF